MATAFGSVASATGATNGDGSAGSGSITVTKPADTASGDLLIALIGNADDNNPWSLSGWTQLFNINIDTNQGYTGLFKVAGGSEPANYTFIHTDAGAGDAVGASIIRYTGTSFVGLANIAYDTGTTTSGTAHEFSTGITPLSNDSILTIGIFARGGAVTFSGYSIDTGNPTWTERVDASITQAGEDGGHAVATGPSASGSATGNWDVTSSGSVETLSVLISVRETTNVTVNATPLIITSTIPNASISAGASVTVTPLVINATLPNATVTGQENTVWTLESKPSDAGWTNESLI